MYTTDMYEGMLAETTTIQGHGGDSIGAYLARPLGTGPFPAVVLIHHVEHNSDGSRSDPIGAGRGASCISQVAQVAWLLEKIPGEPHHRSLKVSGNAILDAEYLFEVSGETAEPGAVNYFRLADPLAEQAGRLEHLIGVDEEITSRELAWRLSGKRPAKKNDRPPGRYGTMAAALRERWNRDGRITVLDDGHGKAKRLRRASDA